jgi:hypothetical protein
VNDDLGSVPRRFAPAFETAAAAATTLPDTLR